MERAGRSVPTKRYPSIPLQSHLYFPLLFYSIAYNRFIFVYICVINDSFRFITSPCSFYLFPYPIPSCIFIRFDRFPYPHCTPHDKRFGQQPPVTGVLRVLRLVACHEVVVFLKAVLTYQAVAQQDAALFIHTQLLPLFPAHQLPVKPPRRRVHPDRLSTGGNRKRAEFLPRPKKGLHHWKGR